MQKITNNKQAGELAADFMYHFMMGDLGSEHEDAINAASDIYTYFTDEVIDINDFLGFDDEGI